MMDRITDSQGRTVDFKNTILIMTNIGSAHLLDGIDENVMVNISVPEFLNRLDETILFKPLTVMNESDASHGGVERTSGRPDSDRNF